MRLLIVLLAFTACCLPSMACDVNLFAIIAGSTKHDAFSESTTRLGIAIKELGENFTFADKAEPLLNQLMNRWVEFSSSFSQFPPDWGKKDPAWKAKFADLGAIIGEIRRDLTSDKITAHAKMLKFSRRLAWLYEFMPMTDQARLLLEFTHYFDGLWAAYYSKDLDLLKKHANDLQVGCKALYVMLSDEDKKLATNLLATAEQVRVMSTQINAFKTVTLEPTLSAAEGEFVALNAKLSATIKAAE